MTETELLDAINDALLPTLGTDDARTVPELCESSGKCYVLVRRALRTLITEGRAQHVKVMRVRVNGVAARTDAYRLK